MTHPLDELESDRHRLTDLTRKYGLSYRRTGNGYQFDDRIGPDAFEDGCIYTAQSFSHALAFAESFDRAKSTKPVGHAQQSSNLS
jgi:hypothetical protein